MFRQTAVKFALALILAAISASGQDIRVVNGSRVDLQPYKKSFGERPMKHWRKVEFMHRLAPLGGFNRVSVNVEGEGSITILIRNLPTSILQHFQRLESLEAKITSLRNYI